MPLTLEALLSYSTCVSTAFVAGFPSWLMFLAGLSDVSSGAVCLSASQVLAFGQAAVRLERRQHRDDERSLLKREFRFYLE